QLITLLVEQAQEQQAKMLIKKEQQSQEHEQCPCEECEKTWFRFLRSTGRHADTDEEKTLTSALMLTSLAYIPVKGDKGVIQLVLDYYGADRWLEVQRHTGLFRDLSWPTVECGYMIGNPMTRVD